MPFSARRRATQRMRRGPESGASDEGSGRGTMWRWSEMERPGNQGARARRADSETQARSPAEERKRGESGREGPPQSEMVLCSV